MKTIIVITAVAAIACNGSGQRDHIMGTGERRQISAMTDVDRFHDAIRKNDVRSALTFIREGVDMQAPDRMGAPPVVLVARYTDDAELLEALAAPDLDATDALKRTALSWAAGQNHTAIVKALLVRGAAVETRDSSGKTPLFHAVLGSAEASVQMLLAKGADVDARDAIEDTPLMMAAAKDNAPMVKLLVDAGADKKSVGSGGRTAAVRATRAEVKRALASP